MKQIFFFSALLILVLFLTPELVNGQPGFPSDPSQAPIDGGLGILAAAGGAYALKKIRDKRA